MVVKIKNYDIDKYLHSCKTNYENSKLEELSSDIITLTSIDYFRILLIKNEKFDLKKFEDWSQRDNNKSFFDLALKDLKTLVENRVLKEIKPKKYVFLDGKRESLFEVQKKHILKNSKRVELLKGLNKDLLFDKIYNNNVTKFKNEVLTDKNELQKFIDLNSTYSSGDFPNNLTIYFDTKEKNVTILKSLQFWENLNIDGVVVSVTDKENFIEVLTAIEDDGVVVGYAKKKLYDISQTTAKDKEFKFVVNGSKKEVIKMLKDSIASSEFFKDFE